jgi:hypothetical protein
VARALMALAIAASAACGRFGFDPVASDVDAGGGPADSSGAGGDGSVPVSGDAGATDCFTVTTPLDEEDAAESPEPPHQGEGLSLREAIAMANQDAGWDCIVFAGAMNIQLAQGLPDVADPDGLRIDGGRRVVISAAGLGADGPGLRLAAGPDEVRGIELTGFRICLVAGAPDSRLGPDLDLHDCRLGMHVTGTDNRLVGVRARANEQHGIQIASSAERADLVQVLAHDNGIDGIRARSTRGLTVRHATLVMNGAAGLDARQGAVQVTVLNSILGQNSGPGVTVDDQSSIGQLDYCDFFEDTCEGCLLGSSSITADPRFADPATRSFALKTGSPCTDYGVDTGLDTNGDAPGRFGGSGPDLGALESD